MDGHIPKDILYGELATGSQLCDSEYTVGPTSDTSQKPGSSVIISTDAVCLI